MERSDRERRELAALFGGRVRGLLGEYRRRNMIDDGGVTLLEWECHSVHWITEAASTLEALRRLVAAI